MECKKCNQTMNEESEDFAKEYEINWCLDCCGKDYVENAEKGTYYHLSMGVSA